MGYSVEQREDLYAVVKGGSSKAVHTSLHREKCDRIAELLNEGVPLATARRRFANELVQAARASKKKKG